MNLQDYKEFFHQYYLEQRKPKIHTEQLDEGHRSMPFFIKEDKVSQFIMDFHDSVFLHPKYKDFLEERGIDLRLVEDYSVFEEEELKAILTFIVRNSRFVEGYLTRKILDGSVYMILEELMKKEK